MIPASIDFVRESLLCTSLCKDGYKIRTVEHLLSALEAKGIDNCRIQIQSLDSEDTEVEVSAIIFVWISKLIFNLLKIVSFVIHLVVTFVTFFPFCKKSDFSCKVLLDNKMHDFTFYMEQIYIQLFVHFKTTLEQAKSMKLQSNSRKEPLKAIL